MIPPARENRREVRPDSLRSFLGGPMVGMMTSDALADQSRMARAIRRWVIEQSLAADVGHIGSALSIAEMLAATWGGVLREPGSDEPGRDHFILAKGHAALALYAAMRWRGLIEAADFARF